MFCRHCGKEIDDDSKFCEFCGVKSDANSSNISRSIHQEKFTSSPTQMQYPEQARAKKSLLLWVALAILVILIAAIAILGILYFQDQQNQNDTQTNRNISENQELSTSEATTEVTEVTTTTEDIPAEIDYTLYDEKLVEMDAGNDDILEYVYNEYYIYDINQDGVYEMILKQGTCEADTYFYFYTTSENSLVEIGELGGSHTGLSVEDGVLYYTLATQGYQETGSITFDGKKIKTDVVFEEDGLVDYVSYGNGLVSFEGTNASLTIKNGETSLPSGNNSSEIATEKATEKATEAPSVTAYAETYSNAPYEGSVSYLYIDGNFDYVTILVYSDSGNTFNDNYSIYTKADNPINLNINVAADSSTVYAEVMPYYDDGTSGWAYTCEVPGLSGIKTVDNLTGQINCHGGTVAGMTTDYVCNGGSYATVRKSLGDTWHVTAKNMYTSYGITWYELWDTDDGDYYGWVDSSYIDFY